MNETRPLGHADQAERAVDAYRLRVKADAVICDDETKLAVIPCQFDSCDRPAAVLDDVVQGFLRNTVKTNRRILRHRSRH